jgi:hypothetical protein
MSFPIGAARRGGYAASAKLTDEQLKERARGAVNARWAKNTPEQRSEQIREQWKRIKARRLTQAA